MMHLMSALLLMVTTTEKMLHRPFCSAAQVQHIKYMYFMVYINIACYTQHWSLNIGPLHSADDIFFVFTVVHIHK